MTLTDGIGRLRGMFDALGQVASGQKLPPATDEAVLEFVRVNFARDIAQNFNEGRDPNGVPWKPLKYRSGQPLLLTGRMASAAVQSVKQANWTGPGRIGFGIRGEPVYWKYQNYGTRRIPPRWFYFPRQPTLQALAAMAAESFGFEILRDATHAV